ncbi:MAG TPA: hypothetical protein VFU98_06560 [Microlunatus sp.]|nr:hypothetical protein [Microlunatus sp.]
MSGVLHPVGPEPARTYWLRRGVLLAVVLVLALGVVFTVSNLTRAAVATAPPPAVLPADTPSPTASTGAGASPSGVSPSGAAPSGVSPPAAASPGARTSSTPPATPTASASSAPSPGASGSASAKAATPTAKPNPTPTTIGTPDCRPADLRITLRGDKTLASGQKSAFRLTLVNRGKQTCLTSITDRNFELKIHSGKDRIWSSRDCSKALAAFDKKLAAGADVGWTVTWNGKRSAAKCKNAPGAPQPGTYWATAQLAGAAPVQLRMALS